MKRTFSRITAIILALALCCFIAACANTEPMAGNPASGKYSLTSYTQDGKSSSASMTLELRTDGTGTIVSNGAKQEIVWDDSTITVDGVKSTYKLTGETLVITEGNTVMSFQRTGNASAPAPDGIKVTNAEWDGLDWEDHNEKLFSISVPKGWSVTSEGASANELRINVKHPTENVGFYWISSLMTPSNEITASSASATVGSTVVPLDPPNVETFFEKQMYGEGSKVSYWKTLETFTPSNYQENADMLKSLGVELLDYKMLRAEWSQDGFDGEGMYAASINSGCLTGYYNVTGVAGMYCGRGDFENWEPVFIQISKSISINFGSSGSGGAASGGSYNVGSTGGYDASDDMIASWDARNKSEDIMAQKRSDATLGYERVYDTETNEIYRADAGFMEEYDKMDGQRYAAATDDMYTEGYSGYISFD